MPYSSDETLIKAFEASMVSEPAGAATEGDDDEMGAAGTENEGRWRPSWLHSAGLGAANPSTACSCTASRAQRHRDTQRSILEEEGREERRGGERVSEERERDKQSEEGRSAVSLSRAQSALLVAAGQPSCAVECCGRRLRAPLTVACAAADWSVSCGGVLHACYAAEAPRTYQ